MKSRRKKPEYIDYGRVIASMNVEGMPWYSPRKQTSGAAGLTSESDNAGSPSAHGASEPIVMTRGETIAFTIGVLKAVLLVGAVFIGGLLAFILFCTEVWFR